jgi:hypothetical protein
MVIGDTVVYDGQAYTVVGFTPVSVTPAELELRPLEGGASFWIDRQLLGEPIAPERAALRLSHKRKRPKN